MREILFRGQTRRYGELVQMNSGKKVPSNWVYGGVCQGTGSFSIIYGSMDVELEQPTEKHVVYTDTIGQYTGLTDKNGKKIFEGDVFQLEEDDILGVVIFQDGCFRIKVYGQTGTFTESGYDECGGGYGVIEVEPIDWYRVGDMQIIGNIHDNPELLGGEC